MSAAKVIFTYKRKRLSSRSGVGQEDACADFSLEDRVDKLQDASNKKFKNPEKNMMIINCANRDDMDCLEPSDNQQICRQLQHACCGEKMPTACSSLALYNSSSLGEKNDVQRSDTTNIRNMVPGSNELSGDNTFKTSSKRVSGGASLEENTSSIQKDSCSLHSRYLEIEGCVQDGSVSQSMEKDSNSLHESQEHLSKTEVAKGQSNAPLLTFSRRLKRKANVCDTNMSAKLLHGKGDTDVRECDSSPVLLCTCDALSGESRLVEKSVEVKVERNDADTRNMLYQSSEKITSNEIGDPSCPCEKSSAEISTLRHMEVASNPGADLVVDTSPVNKQTAVRTSGSIVSALHNPGTVGSTSIHKDNVRCCSYDGTVISSCNVACKTDDKPVSQLRASSGDSQLTSSDSSDLKIGAAKRVEHGARLNSFDLSCPPTGGCVIDCNVVPESDIQEDASDIIQDSLMVKNCEKVMQKEHTKSKGLELFGDYSMHVEDSPDGVCTSTKAKNKPETKFLQLFSEDEKYGQHTPPNTFSKVGHSKAHQNAFFALDTQRRKVDQPSSKGLPVLGLSLPTELIHEGQTSKDGPTTNQYHNSNARACNIIQNPVFQSFPNQTSFRHKKLLESINTRATSLRGNRNISLDKFEPCPPVWSEEELDSLWIGIRRHGRGNWHAMLLDPRLRFAPWRVAGDLEDQWEREQHRLFSGQHMPSSRYLKPQDAYRLYCPSPVACHGNGGRRENFAAETQLSLGDVYAQKDGVTLSSSAPRNGITQAQRHVTMAGCSTASYGYGPFNNAQASVMFGGEISPNIPAMAFGTENCLHHWLRDLSIIPSRPLDPPLPPPVSTLPQVGGHRLVHAFPETSCRGKTLNNSKLDAAHPPGHSQCGGPLVGKPGTADNLIVIDSDASSEETISDDKNIRS